MKKTIQPGKDPVKKTSRKHTDEILLELKAREHEQSILLCVGNRIAAARNRADLGNIVEENILNVFSASYYSLCLIDEKKQTHQLFLSGPDAGTKSSFDRILQNDMPVNDGIWNLVLAAPEPVILNLETWAKKKEGPAWIRELKQQQFKEMVAVVVNNGNTIKGFFCFYSYKINSFIKDKFSLLDGLVAQIGTGVCNVLGNEKIEQQLQQIERYKEQLEEENYYLQQENNSAYNFTEFIGNSKQMQAVFKLVSKVAASDATVLVMGETGTGKELVARAIHEASGRKNKLMIKVNCAAIPAALIESELFGHEKGSFTGATERRLGKFELADNSTLFLDEIGELPAELQVKLLRVLQEKEIERVGGRGTIKVNVRIIAATNRNLQEEVEKGTFRNDLYYRLNVFPITLPPLRNRAEDIAPLATHFINRYAKNAGKKITRLSSRVLEDLLSYSWPGNVRELQHQMERSVLLSAGNTIKTIYLPAESKKNNTGTENEFKIKTLEEVEREYILKVVKKCNGRISGQHGAAVKLGVPSTTLMSKMQRLGIKKEHFVEK